MVDHPSIKIKLNTAFDENFNTTEFDHIFYSGPIDKFFNYKYGRLTYRTVTFEKFVDEGDHQGNAVINYADEAVKYTRVHEHKHFTPWENHDKTVYFREYSKETEPEDIPYYPKRLANDMEILQRYQNDVNKLENYSFIGRLATYRYLDMHHVINESIQTAKEFVDRINSERSFQEA